MNLMKDKHAHLIKYDDMIIAWPTNENLIKNGKRYNFWWKLYAIFVGVDNRPSQIYLYINLGTTARVTVQTGIL